MEVPARTPDPVALEASHDYLLGAALLSSAPQRGSDGEQRLRLRPIWAFRLGRFRFATSGDRVACGWTRAWDNFSPGWRITPALNRHWVAYAGLNCNN